jgi:hypothetical protein
MPVAPRLAAREPGCDAMQESPTMNESQAALSATRWQAQRPLSEPVLESVEEELGADQSQPSSRQPAEGLHSRPGNGIDTSGQAWWMRMQQQLARQISQRPTQAALLALGVGAAVVALLGRGSRRSSRRD